MFNQRSGYSAELRETNIMARVYGWMSFALGLTAFSAYYVSQTPALMHAIVTNQFLMIGLFIFQVGLVIGISKFIDRFSFQAAFAIYVAYALSLGVTLSVIFMVYTMASIMTTFVVAAGMFASMALYGYFTKADLTSMGSLLFMALIGLILAGLVNMFVQSEKFDIVLSGIGVLIFTLLVAYDAQRIKHMAQELLADRETINKVALLGALALYLDFVNLFLNLLRLMGKKQE